MLVAVVVVGVGVGVVVGVVVEVVMIVAVAVVGGGVVVGGNSCSHGAGAEANFMQTACGQPRPWPEAVGTGSGGCSACSASY